MALRSRRSRWATSSRRRLSSKAEKLHAKAEKLHATVDRISAKAKVQAESLERLAARLESVDLWMRDEPGQRQARFTRSELAQTAISIVDAEGLEALSMRRLAAELGAGTMTLYHYVRTKDELLTLVSDEVMAEVLLPEGRARRPTGGRRSWSSPRAPATPCGAIRGCSTCSGDLGLGPNSVKHMDQTLQAVDGIEAPLATKLDVVVAVDEYVFGYCLQERAGRATTSVAASGVRGGARPHRRLPAAAALPRRARPRRPVAGVRGQQRR